MSLQSVQHEAACGSAYSARLQLRDASGAAVTTWTSAATLAVRAWPGGSFATAFTPTAAWVDATAGTLTLSIGAGDTTAIAPGLYELALAIEGGPERPIGTIRLTPGPGTDAEPPTYCSLLDLTALVPWIEDAEDLGPGLSYGLATNFLKQRADARTWLDGEVMARARKALTSQQRYRWGDGAGWFGGWYSSGYAAGSPLAAAGPSTRPDTFLEDALALVKTALDADGLMLDAAPGCAVSGRRIAASYALYLALRHLPGGSKDGMLYRELATEFRKDARNLLLGWRAAVDADADGLIGEDDYLLEP